MNCTDIDDRLADRYDDLLGASEVAEIDAHLAVCQACTERAREFAALREVLYRKEDIGPPPDDLAARIIAAAAVRRPSRLAALIRYAAVFLAGAGAAFVLRPAPPDVTVPAAPIVAERPAESQSAVVELSGPRIPRRIR